MKFKTSAIALAVAGTVAAPIAVQAGADEIYASARIGLWNVDKGGESEMDVRSFSSRFGAKGETDLGNGMTGFGRYEWDVDLGEGGGTGVRHRYVGLKGDFGSVLVGQTNHTFYNHVVGPIDNPWWHAGYTTIRYGKPGSPSSSRADNAITYAGSTGAISFGVTGYFDADLQREAAANTASAADFDANAANQQAVIDLNNALIANASNPGTFTAAEIAALTAATSTSATASTTDSGAEDGIDALEVGVSFGIGDMTLGVAMQDVEIEDDEVIGVALSGLSLGDTSWAFSYLAQDDDSSIIIDVGIGNAYVHVESSELDAADRDPMGITLGYFLSLGRKTSMYFEVFDQDADSSNSDDDNTTVMGVMKYDII